MMYIYITIAIIITVFALVETINVISRTLLTSKQKSAGTNIIIIPVSGHIDDVEYFIRGFVHKGKWNGVVRPDNIIIADMGIDEETRKICMLLCEEFEFVYICDSREVISFLDEGIYMDNQIYCTSGENTL